MIKKLAKITSAKLEIQERGILNFWIHVKYEDGFSQGIGGIALDQYCPERRERVGTAYGCEVIRQLLLALDVDDFSEMKGKILWVLGTEVNRALFKTAGIQPLKVNKDYPPVIFDDILAEFSE